MTEAAPAATGTLTASTSLTTVNVSARRKVRYVFDTSATKRDLALPYRVSIDGKVQEAAPNLRKLSGSKRSIELLVAPGARVALFLNSDVHPDFRREPVYALQVGEHDVEVVITEKQGRISHARAEVGTSVTRQADQPGERAVDCYKALLTGDIWMQISHLYTAAQADAILPPETPPPVRVAVRAIYSGLPAAQLLVQFPASDVALAHALRVAFADSENARANITYYSLLKDVLPRTHPAAFAALLSEAYKAGVTEVHVTSCWRPMLGSIAHRAGLGLDIVYIANASQTVHINRVGLTGAGGRNPNVTTQEKQRYEEYMEASKQVNLNNNGTAQTQSEREQKIGRRDEAKDQWNKARNESEPVLMNVLRSRLGKHTLVSQIFDPWYMEPDTGDLPPPVANEQRNGNEKIHSHHLHITVKEPNIL
ncbi:hypothetical protein O0882_25570 [Janthinobacterium sp. SUN073]|uniref:hypothetical protein n=1 Tax=Janthinobacterium sp. SUN073 TaxID=3004102 RepID=UPI0025B032CA|nr:hypothetical protein [Janthinobacterium sp. SUN073]MDN2699692.1 hypothetical protein [Janthinobacterium sp. SUN073]